MLRRDPFRLAISGIPRLHLSFLLPLIRIVVCYRRMNVQIHEFFRTFRKRISYSSIRPWSAKLKKAVVADDDVVQDFDLHDVGRKDELFGDFSVAFGWFGISRGVVVDKDERGGRVSDGGFDDLSGIDGAGVHGPLKKGFFLEDQVFGVEKEDLEFLCYGIAKRMIEVVEDLFWRSDTQAGSSFFPSKRGGRLPERV